MMPLDTRLAGTPSHFQPAPLPPSLPASPLPPTPSLPLGPPRREAQLPADRDAPGVGGRLHAQGLVSRQLVVERKRKREILHILVLQDKSRLAVRGCRNCRRFEVMQCYVQRRANELPFHLALCGCVHRLGHFICHRYAHVHDVASGNTMPPPPPPNMPGARWASASTCT